MKMMIKQMMRIVLNQRILMTGMTSKKMLPKRIEFRRMKRNRLRKKISHL
jgi:hypothetical protein